MSEFDLVRQHLEPSIHRSDVEKVLRAAVSEPNPWDLFARARVPFPYAISILRVLSTGGWLTATRPSAPGGAVQFAFTPRGAALAQELGAYRTPSFICPLCGGSGAHGLEETPLGERFREVFQGRPRNENPELDQGAMTPPSLFRRLAWMIHQGDVEGKEIVVLGDDDLLSLALALTGLPQRVTVLEIDPRLCEYIEVAANDRSLPVRVIPQDLCDRLPEDLAGHFDTFACDPPETEAGLLLFAEKGLALLKAGEGHAGYFGATVIEASLAKWARWQKRLLNENAIAITHVLPPFTAYEAWPDEKPVDDLAPLARLSSTPWYRFAYYRIETLPEFEPVPDFAAEHAALFYFDDEGYYRAWKAVAAGNEKGG